jgi:hypothetical protein
VNDTQETFVQGCVVGVLTIGTMPVFPPVRRREQQRVAVSVSIGARGKRRGGLNIAVCRARLRDAKGQAVKDLEALKRVIDEAIKELQTSSPEAAEELRPIPQEKQ